MIVVVKNIDYEKAFIELAKIDYGFYVEYAHKGLYKPAKHTELICNKLQLVEAGKIKRIMFLMPPRHSKSMTVTETFPSYFIGKNSERRVIVSSYGDALAQKFGRENKRIVEDYGKQIFDITLSKTNMSNVNWGIAGHRGGMISAGIGGSITGEGADCLIIDDPVKNRQEASSLTYRNMVWNEYQSTLLTRLHAGGSVIIILTRWHEDDLAGRILKNSSEEWDIVSLPAEAESENDLLGRRIGEPLWPENGYDIEWLKAKKKEVGSQVWASLYQQRPSVEEGNLFQRNWWKFYTRIPKLEQYGMSVDCTFKDTKDTDYVVLQIWGRSGGDYFLLDQVRQQMGIIATMSAVRTLYAKWPQASTKLIEDKANGSAVIEMLRREIPGLIPINPEGGKIVRAQAVSPFAESGNIWLPDPTIAGFVHDFIEEATAFPNGLNDDQVDSMTQMINYWESKPRVRIRSLG